MFSLEGEETELIDLPSALDEHLPLDIAEVAEVTVVHSASSLLCKLLH